MWGAQDGHRSGSASSSHDVDGSRDVDAAAARDRGVWVDPVLLRELLVERIEPGTAVGGATPSAVVVAG
jgi:hypothetical protein